MVEMIRLAFLFTLLSIMSTGCDNSSNAGDHESNQNDAAELQIEAEPDAGADEVLPDQGTDMGTDRLADLSTESEQDIGMDAAIENDTENNNCPEGIPRPPPNIWMNWLPIPDSPPLSAYTVTADTVIDSQTCLMWQRVVTTDLYDWSSALEYCTQLRLLGYADWRLPTVVELQSILDRTTINPTINTTAFPDTLSDVEENWYWTSTPVTNDPTYSWIVGFLYGVSSPNDVNSSIRVRCVR